MFKEHDNVFVKISYIPTLDTFRCLRIKEYHKGEYKLYSLEPVWDDEIKAYKYEKQTDNVWVSPESIVKMETVIPNTENDCGSISSKKNAFIYYKYVEWLKSIGVKKTAYELAVEVTTIKLKKMGKSDEYISEFIGKLKEADIKKGKLYISLKEPI